MRWVVENGEGGGWARRWGEGGNHVAMWKWRFQKFACRFTVFMIKDKG